MKMQRNVLIAFLIFFSFSFVLANNCEAKADDEQKQIDVLLSEATLFAKVTACQRLACIGTGKSVETLSSLLCDESLRGYVRYAMEGIDDPRVDDAFGKALGECTGKMRIGIINSIGVRRDAKATGQLIKLALDPDSDACTQALAALGRIASDDAIDTIKKALKRNSQTLRLAAGDAALTAAERLLVMNNQKDALKLYVAIGKADVPKHLQTAALYGEIIARGPDGLPQIIKLLKSDDPAMVAVGLRGARQSQGAKVTRILADELPELSPKNQVLLIKVLSDRNDPGAIKGIEAFVGSDRLEVRVESLKALGQIGDISIVPALLKAASSGGEEAAIARTGLLRIKGVDVDEAIIKCMQKSKPDVKVKLIDVLSARNATTALEAIFTQAQSSSAKVAKASFKAIRVLAGPDDVVRIVNLIESLKSDSVRKEAVRAVVTVSGKVADKSKRADAIIAAFKREKKVSARCSYIRILGAIANSKSFEVVKPLIDDKNEQIQDGAVRAIVSWPNTDALDITFAIFKNTGNKLHRTLALRGYIRLLKQDKQTATAKKAEILGAIIGQVNTVAEKKKILSGLATVNHPSAMTITSKYIADPDVKDEAMLAAIQIGQSIAGASRGQVKPIAQEIIKKTSNDAVRKQAQALLKTIENFEDFITAWQVSPQYLQAAKNYSQLLDIAFAPETGGDVVWDIMPAGTNPAKAWLLDLLKIYSGSNRVVYAFTWVHSATQQKARLELGSDDGNKVWLNGKLVHANNTARAAIPGSDKADVQLEKGWNKLMVKVTQNTGGWGFCVRLRDPAGNRLQGIKVDCLYQEPVISLFDGKTFTGWEGDLKWFRIQDGAVVAGKLSEKIPHNFFLATTKEYYNFELRLKAKNSKPSVNGGIQFRSKRIPNHHEVTGYQADIRNGIWGALYDESRRNKFLLPPNKPAQKTIKNNDWNDYVIRCVNDRIQLFVNGVKTVDYTETDPAIAKQAGIIALQIHGGPPAEVCYKGIVIKELR